jgi:hypothetical protein
MPKKVFDEHTEYNPNINGFELLMVSFEKLFLFLSYRFGGFWGRAWKFVKDNVFLSFVLLLVICIFVFSFGIAARRGINNINNSKLSLIEKVKSLVLSQNSFDKIQTLNQIESQIISDLGAVGQLPLLGSIVQNDIGKFKDLISKWIDIINPFSNYKLSVDGFKTTLLQERYFTQDLEKFFENSPGLVRESKGFLGSLWIYKLYGSETIRTTIQNLENYLDIIQILTDNKDLVLKIFGHFETQKVVIFNQNTAEARPTGGFLGSYIPIDISKGEMNVGVSQSIYTFDQGSPLPLVAHPATWYYGYLEGLNDLHGARNSNVFPCFPDSAKYLQREFSRSINGYNIDDLIMITPDFLLGYLPDNFEVIIDGKPVPKSKILDTIERLTAFEVAKDINPKQKITSIFSLIVTQLPNIIKGQSLLDLINYTQDSIKTRQFQLWFRNEEIQKLWSSTGYSGETTCLYKQTSDNVIVPLLINLSGDKRNLVTTNDYEFQVSGKNLKIKYTQIIPNNASDILQRGFNDTGTNMIGLQLPKNAKLKSLRSKQLLKLPFLRNYYTQELDYNSKGKNTTPPEIQNVINTSLDFSQENDKGFSYIQPDGSEVVGGYFLEDFVTEVEFDIELGNSSNLYFYPQPGQRSLVFRKDGRLITDQKLINNGMRLR